jgi:BirA family biotin operon repressor/biotin-[acetyl-CoA-carboxylase] ligase
MIFPVPAGWRIDARDCVGSTNDEARILAVTGAADRTVVWARRQKNGRGRRGRPWQSPPGNLYCSVVLRWPPPIAGIGQLPFVIALALADAAAAFGVDARIKWPNDILVRGAKLAGILLESSVGHGGVVDWVVAGAGLNVANHPEIDAYRTTDLHGEGAGDATPAAVLSAYLAAFDGHLAAWRRDGFAPIREAWCARAIGLGQPIEVRLERETVGGVFADLDGDGALVLADCHGARRRVLSGDVFLRAA